MRRSLQWKSATVLLFLCWQVGAVDAPPRRISDESPLRECNEPAQPGETVFTNAEVEPFIAVNPHDTNNVISVWQQDAFSGGGSRGLVSAYSFDGGRHWQQTFAHFSRCTNGNERNGGDYARAADPWVSFSPTGIAHQISVSFNTAGVEQAILASRSLDGGRTWSEPATLLRDTAAEIVDDKQSITADPTRSRYVYAVWGRLEFTDASRSALVEGPTWFARSTNGGASWRPATSIYRPGAGALTIANQIVVLPDGTLVNLFARIGTETTGGTEPSVAVIRSFDRGRSWSEPTVISSLLTASITDPNDGQAVRSGDIIPDIAVDARRGTLYVVWQDARFSNNGKRDGIAMSRSYDGGVTWSAPRQVNQAPDVQAFTASVDVADDGKVAVTYYDFRTLDKDTNRWLTDYWEITSEDDGTTWDEQRLTTSAFDIAHAVPVNNGLFLGDYQGLTHAASDFVPLFVQANKASPLNLTDVYLKED